MSLSDEQVMAIMAYADGELDSLDSKARAGVIELLQESEAARRVLESFRHSPIGDFLRENADADGAARGADSIADAVMANLPAPAPAPVVPIRSGGATKAVLAISFAMFAAAAGVLLYLRSDDSAGGRVAKGPVAHADAGATLATSKKVAHGVTVEEVQSPDHDFKVFEIPASGAAASLNSSSVVIWVEDKEKLHHDAD